jgi:raffinose/stachyose/melibiose transport system permease protein
MTAPLVPVARPRPAAASRFRVSRRGRRRAATLGLSAAIATLALAWMSPMYLVFVNSLKDFGAILRNAAALPDPVVTGNYEVAWELADFATALLNSVFVTVLAVGGLVLIGAMAAWRMARRPHRWHRVLFSLFVVAMVVPFQTLMIPTVQLSTWLGIVNTRSGLILLYLSFGMPLTVFFLQGFVQSSVPREIEEAARIDGASSWQTFRLVVLPLMRPMIATVSILHAFWIWNDFLLPLLVLFDPARRTIPLAIFSFFGVHSDQWDLATAALVMGMVPIIVFFLIFQRFIITGVAAGSLKG